MGGLVVHEARARGHETVVLSRSRGVDLTTGSNVDGAIVGTDAVIDATNLSTLDADESRRFFAGVTRTLLAAEERAGVEHHIALSIVGVDRAPFDYYAGKRAQEVMIEAGPVPWTILRATQFHEFAGQVFATAKAGPVHIAPKMRTQPIAAREVATRLVDLAESRARDGHVEIAGPREESLVDMIRRWARATGHRGWIPAVSLLGGAGKAQRDGTLLAGEGAEIGFETFDAWLTRTTG
ncbi:NAD(P)H-binding protein [Microbacterium awajiense]|uniref:NAD(P)H-binding protein n=2 Tax=Microbacterium awajiense TaxID=415214 RepID=A0ABP7AWX6_9MICO